MEGTGKKIRCESSRRGRQTILRSAPHSVAAVPTWLVLLVLAMYVAVSLVHAEDDNSSSQVVSPTTDEPEDEVVIPERTSINTSEDGVDDGVFDPISPDPSCNVDGVSDGSSECWNPPESTIETEEQMQIDVTCSYGGDDPSSQEPDQEQCVNTEKTVLVDKHWGSDENILKMREMLRRVGSGASGRDPTASTDEQEQKPKPHENRRPPVFLMPGLASTRLVSWKFKGCDSPFLSDVKVQDYVWLNINMLVQMGTIKADCWKECITLGLNQTDMDDLETGCKLRPDEGLDAISSLAPGSIGSNLLVGGTNTVYAWLIQWLADNLGYDVSSIVGLPYDWRLSPNVMEKRDGFLTLTKLRIEAAVKTNGEPGIMVAHSMGNSVFRYFLEWLRHGMREEAYAKLIKKAERRAKTHMQQQQQAVVLDESGKESMLPGWMGGVVSSFDEWWNNFGAENDKDSDETTAGSTADNDGTNKRYSQLWELAQMEGDNNYIEWLETHIWSYVGLSAPLLGAVNPLRAVISGENMGLPITDEVARAMELSFGSTHTCNPISSKMGFCDRWDEGDWGEEEKKELRENRARLACLDDIVNDIESGFEGDPWLNFPQLRVLLKDRVDWDSDFPMMQIVEEHEGENSAGQSTVKIGPRHAQSGELFNHFSETWKEQGEPMVIKREQLEQAFWATSVPNILNMTWDRPHIKHIIMAYGVDVPTEAGYVYRKTRKAKNADASSDKTNHDGMPTVEKVIWEEAHGTLVEEQFLDVKGKTLTDSLIRKKVRKQKLDGGDGNGTLLHSGDGTIPYLSLSWAHTWLLHAARATMYSKGERIKPDRNPLDAIKVSHRPKGGSEWEKGGPKESAEEEAKAADDGDTGTTHPHGTKYKPTMVRFQSVGKSRTTGMEYSTTVIEAIGVEHKETTRNYDILAAVFTDVLEHMHEDFGLI